MRRRDFLSGAMGLPLAIPAGAAAAGKAAPKLIFDTDIGTDVDDAIALVLLGNSPEVRLSGVTTVFRNTTRRAQYARQILDAMRSEIPCFAGCAAPMSPRGPVLRGFAERVMSQSIAADGNDGDLGGAGTPAISTVHAVDFLVQATREPDGPRHVLCAGPQTNLAVALVKDPGLADRLEAVTVMGYNFKTAIDPYNVGSDLTAARRVLSSGIPLRVLPVEIGIACQMNPEEYAKCLASSCRHMKILSASLRQWVQYVRHRPGAPIPDYLPRPYDSLAAMTITHPALFQWKRGTIRLEPGEDPSKTKAALEESAGGIHEVVVGVDRERAMAVHLQRLLACPG